MATIYWRGKNNDIAYLNYTDPVAGQVRISLGKITEQEAEAQRLAIQRQLTKPALGFKNFAIEYLDWHKHQYPSSHNRIYQITHQHLLPWLGNQDMNSIDEYTLERYKHYRRQVSAETVNKELRTINAIINRAVRWKRIDTNPIRELPLIRNLNSKPPHYYSTAELAQLYAYSNDFCYRWQFLANTGLRRSEYLQFSPDTNIRDNNLIIHSSAHSRTKSGKYRILPISQGAADAMQHNYLYHGRRESLSRAFAKCAKRADLPGSLHSLRHSFGSHLVMQGVTMRAVQELMGHANIKTTEQYIHLSPSHRTRAVENLRL